MNDEWMFESMLNIYILNVLRVYGIDCIINTIINPIWKHWKEKGVGARYQSPNCWMWQSGVQ